MAISAWLIGSRQFELIGYVMAGVLHARGGAPLETHHRWDEAHYQADVDEGCGGESAKDLRNQEKVRSAVILVMLFSSPSG